MKKISYVLSIVLMSFSTYSCIASNEYMENPSEFKSGQKAHLPRQESIEFKGNWTDTFYFKNGSSIIHTPQYVSLGLITSGAGISLKGKLYNNMPMSENGLVVITNSTREEFIEALVKSNLYEKK